MSAHPTRRSQRLLVIRHAQSEHHVRGLTGGWTDTGLTELGREQASLLAARLRRELTGTPVALYASDLRRGLETAAPIAAALGLPARPEPRLREHNNGAAAGLTHAEAVARFPESYGRRWDTDFRPFPGAETWREFDARICSFLNELPLDGAVPVLVTHGAAVVHIVAWWLGLGVEDLERIAFGADPASIAVLTADEGPGYQHRIVERLNDLAHLHGAGTAPLLPRQ